MAIFGRLVLLLALVARVGADRGLREDDARSPAPLAQDFFEPNLSRPRLSLTETNHGREAEAVDLTLPSGPGGAFGGDGQHHLQSCAEPGGSGGDRSWRIRLDPDCAQSAPLAQDFLEPRLSWPFLSPTETNHGPEAETVDWAPPRDLPWRPLQ